MRALRHFELLTLKGCGMVLTSLSLLVVLSVCSFAGNYVAAKWLGHDGSEFVPGYRSVHIAIRINSSEIRCVAASGACSGRGYVCLYVRAVCAIQSGF